ncbi:glycoside hydrolase family 99-like domain-containing protein [Flavobacterium sp. P4023]|uniref:Glycoside hydrolase family 99-like domain-containing protein n=1 Tax=Flavobacterium flabelliforme TaxID=2816119 RepID=A0ABS5CPH9_9FLAO|nr:glycoside hydrolase family 99-like domain-containing protein [Flavobacterium flabelliforme]MBP4140522.1 glycoside hydrolase family 99-like domain-containing protein [Flavobacterium flabelliforme]
MPQNKIQFLAYYLPQYHPIPENDLWWGKGFTEWTNVAKAKPLFKGHNQPILPGELGFYDLRVSEVQEQQAQLAQEYGIDGFIYYQYWFGNGKMLLEKPAEAMLKNKNISFPFCFCWANETWKGIWHGLDNNKVLIEQTYQGEQGYRDYFDYLLPFFKDERYIKIDNKPMFHVYKFDDIPDIDLFLEVFNRLAKINGFDGVWFVATHANPKTVMSNPEIYGQVGVDVFNAMRYEQSFKFRSGTFFGKVERKVNKKFHFSLVKWNPFILDYGIAIEKLKVNFIHKKYIACVFPNWDNSARIGKKAMIFKNATPENWGKHLKMTLKEVKNNQENPPFVVIKSWNEWAEGNHLEPDANFAREWLEVINKIKNTVLPPKQY